MQAFTTYLLPLLSLAPWALADEGWNSHCNSPQLFQPNYAKNGAANNVLLTANCQYSGGSNAAYNVATSIDLNQCFTNINGVLQGQYGGNFGGSCKNLYLDGSVMHAQCIDDNHNYADTSIDTYYYVGDNNGRMSCFGQEPLS